MINLNELQVGNIYKHERQRLYARVLYIEGDGEEGTVTVEQYGERIELDKHNFLLRYSPISIPSLDA